MKTLNLVLLLSLVAACSKVEKQMSNFEKNTDELRGTTSDMQLTAKDIKEIATSIFPQIRSGDTARIRNEEWDILTNKEKDLGEKMVAGGIFFQALEYQFWTANNGDDKIVLEQMQRDAADEFQGRMFDLYSKIKVKKMSPLKRGKRQNEEMAFYALAFTIDRGHYFQGELARKYPKLKLVTFQDMIKNALTKEKNNHPVAKHEAILLAGVNKEIITELLRARVDILVALGLRDLVDERNMTIGNYSKAAVFLATGGRMGSICVPDNVGTANIYTKQNVLQYLNEAKKAKEFLTSVGVKHKMEKRIKSAFQAIDFDEEVRTSNDSSIAEIKKIVEELY
jgi:hypothetical protein